MNNVVLDETQLLLLKRFIKQKGIKEEDVIHEILDHLACKVEELMTEHIYLSFEKAVEKSYYSFGFNGFNQMKRQYEKSLNRIVWNEYKKSLPKVMFSRLMVGLFLWCTIQFVLLLFIQKHQIYDELSIHLSYTILASMLVIFGIRFYSNMIAKDGLADYSFDNNIKLWQKKVIKLPRVDFLGLPFIYGIIFLKLEAHYYLIIFLLFSLLGLLNSLMRKETMKRMNLKFETIF